MPYGTMDYAERKVESAGGYCTDSGQPFYQCKIEVCFCEIKSLHLLRCELQQLNYLYYERKNNSVGGVVYESPVCTPVEVFSEGILCESFGNESFKSMGENDTAPSYGSGIDNNGWY